MRSHRVNRIVARCTYAERAAVGVGASLTTTCTAGSGEERDDDFELPESLAVSADSIAILGSGPHTYTWRTNRGTRVVDVAVDGPSIVRIGKRGVAVFAAPELAGLDTIVVDGVDDDLHVLSGADGHYYVVRISAAAQG